MKCLKINGKLIKLDEVAKYGYFNGEREYEVWIDGVYLHNQIVHKVYWDNGTHVITTTNGKELNFKIPGSKFSWMNN